MLRGEWIRHDFLDALGIARVYGLMDSDASFKPLRLCLQRLFEIVKLDLWRTGDCLKLQRKRSVP